MPDREVLLESQGFTLIELSIVLVIIGLIVGGILVGRDLISAAVVRAQISQIEKYNQAVDTFKGKYGYLPGDIPDPDASRFGFAARGTDPGQGDGNGIIQAAQGTGMWFGSGENLMFWVDLSQAKLISESFLPGATVAPPVGAYYITGTTLDLYTPRGKLNDTIHVNIFSGDDGCVPYFVPPNPMICQQNYFGVWQVTEIRGIGYSASNGNPGITVAQAYAIDKKTDDGLPLSGNVVALWLDDDVLDYGIIGAQNSTSPMGPTGSYGASDLSPTPSSGLTCYDNGNTNGVTQAYSVGYNNGAGVNCALSFKLQ